MAKLKKKMPKWAKSPADMVKLFNGIFTDMPKAEKRKMFSYPVAFAADNMFCGLFQNSTMLRLFDSDRETFLQRYNSKLFEPMPGRPMREYVAVPNELIQLITELKGWIAKSFTYASSIPKKHEKNRKGKATRKTKHKA